MLEAAQPALSWPLSEISHFLPVRSGDGSSGVLKLPDLRKRQSRYCQQVGCEMGKLQSQPFLKQKSLQDPKEHCCTDWGLCKNIALGKTMSLMCKQCFPAEAIGIVYNFMCNFKTHKSSMWGAQFLHCSALRRCYPAALKTCLCCTHCFLVQVVLSKLLSVLTDNTNN